MTAIALIATGAMCFFAPRFLSITASTLIGGILLVVAALQMMHLCFGWIWIRDPNGVRPTVSGMVVLNATIGGCLIWASESSRWWISLLIVAAVALEGGLLFYVSVRLVETETKWWMWTSGSISIIVALLSLQRLGSPLPTLWIGYLLSIKLFMIALALLYVAIVATNDQIRIVYTGLACRAIEPQMGSIYAVFYGPAFHCGIAVEGRRVVDYLTDGVVRVHGWEDFLQGRTAMEWNYPDVPVGDPKAVSDFALRLVGQHTKYDAFQFNCESLAIQCRSLGAVDRSRYSQATIGLNLLSQYPVMGTLLQIFNRVAAWFLYGVGGPFGKRFGFFLISLSRWVTNLLVWRR